MRLSILLYEGRIRINDIEIINNALIKYRTWLKQFGIDISKPGNYIGDEGGVGTALFFGDKVIKLTSDEKEFKIANKLTDESIPNLAHIYGAINVGDIDNDGRPEFMIVMEKVDTGIPVNLRTAGSIVYDYLDEINEYSGIGGVDNFKSKSIEQIFNEIKQMNIRKRTSKKALAAKFRKDERIQKLVLKLIAALKNIYDKTGIVLVDTHGRNLGFQNSDIVLFDVGRAF